MDCEPISAFAVIPNDLSIKDENFEDDEEMRGIFATFETKPPSKRTIYTMGMVNGIKVFDFVYTTKMEFIGMVRTIKSDGYMEIVDSVTTTWLVRELNKIKERERDNGMPNNYSKDKLLSIVNDNTNVNQLSTSPQQIINSIPRDIVQQVMQPMVPQMRYVTVITTTKH